MYRAKHPAIFSLFLALVSLWGLSALAAPPALPLASINQEGLLLDLDGSPLEGEVQLGFAIYDVSQDGVPLWSDSYTVELHQGYYDIALGPMPSEIFFADQLYLGIQVNGQDELTPRHRFEHVAFAVGANFAVDVLGDIHPRSITASGNISTTGDVVAQGVVRATNALVGPNVTSGQDPGHLHTGAAVVDGSLRTADLADQAVTTDKLANLSVTSAKLGTGSVVAG